MNSLDAGSHTEPVQGEIANVGEIHSGKKPGIKSFWGAWFHAFKQVLPLYIIMHVVTLVGTCLSMLYTLGDFTQDGKPFYMVWQAWNRLDTTHFDYIASHSYTDVARTAFFPLQPLLIRALLPLTHNAFLTGFFISNVAALLLMMVLYQLVKEDFNAELAERTVLYLMVFPLAFFFIAAYNESLFLCLALLSFYQMRRGRWWLAGLSGFFACLTRSAGILLLVPLCYEYLRQRDFQIKKVRIDIASLVLPVLGLGAFALYCYWHFGDPLAFSHAQAEWHRHLQWPWYGMFNSVKIILRHYFLSFYSLRNLTDLIPDLFILLLLVLCFVGPWRLPRSHRSYGLYAVVLYLFIQLFPVDANTNIPLQSVGRLMLEIFPAFIVLAAMGKNRSLHLGYLLISGSLYFFLLSQFISQRWMV